MVSPSITNVLLLLRIVDAVSTVTFRPLEPHLLTVSGSRHFESPEESESESESDNGIIEVTDDENSPPTKAPPRVAIRDSSLKLWNLSAGDIQ